MRANLDNKVRFKIGSVVRIKKNRLKNSVSQGRYLIVIKFNYESQSFLSFWDEDEWNAEAFEVVYE